MMNKADEAALVRAAVAALGELGIDVSAEPAPPGANHDAMLTIHRDNKKLRFRAEVKRPLLRSVISFAVLAAGDAKDDRILVTDYITPPIAEQLREHSLQFVDTAGNVFINRRGLFVLVSGRRLRTVPPPRPPRVFQPTGIKIVFAILSSPRLLAQAQRNIASAAGVSLGSVPIVLQGLAELGYVAEVRGTRRLVNREKLVQQWTEAYARTLEPALMLGRFSTTAADWWQHTDLVPYGAQWGGETAAALLHRSLRPQQVVIYTSEIPHHLISRYRMKADGSGNVMIRRRFWNAVPSPRADIVPALLIYADLMAAGDARSIDAARQIRDDHGF